MLCFPDKRSFCPEVIVLNENNKLKRTLSPVGAISFSLGTSIGWGSLVVTSNTYLMQAGPLGSTLGMIVGGCVMLLIAYCYSYLMSVYPDAGGAYAYSREVFGHDHGFLTAWFLSLVYLAILWANATSIPLFVRYFAGDALMIVRLYTVFGYDVYLGEALLSVLFLLLTAVLCSRFKRAMEYSMIAMAAIFTIGIMVAFIGGITRSGFSFSPAFAPDSAGFSQVVKIAVISPWAFIGFENISHFTEEASFPPRRNRRILFLSILITTLLYIFITLLSVTAYPPEYATWLDYIRDLGNLSGLKALPAFYAAEHYMGSFSVGILMLSLLCLILTSLIGNVTALSRLFRSLGRDKVLPGSFSAINRYGVPGRAIFLAVGVSVFFPFLGRTVIGWIVDVTTIGATLIYTFVASAVTKIAAERHDTKERVIGVSGLILMAAYGAYLLIPNLFTVGSMETESYFIFALWSLLGFIYFRMILRRDTERRYGNSIIVWISLFSLVMFISLVWLCRSILDATGEGMSAIESYYTATGIDEVQVGVVSAALDGVRGVISQVVTTVVLLIATSLGVLISNYNIVTRRAHISEHELHRMQEVVSRDPLTGVKSRQSFTELERLVDERIVSGEAGSFGVVVCDMNGLKEINDTYGHKVGDERLKEASALICGVFSHSPVVPDGRRRICRLSLRPRLYRQIRAYGLPRGAEQEQYSLRRRFRCRRRIGFPARRRQL